MFRKAGSPPLSALERAPPPLPPSPRNAGGDGTVHGEALSVARPVSGFSVNTATPRMEEQLR